MIFELEDTSKAESLFAGWEETLIYSCIEKVMGKILVTDINAVSYTHLKLNFNFLSKTVLFRGMSEKDIECMLDCLAAKQQHFSKGDIIFQAGDVAQSMGLILTGSANIENDDIWGNKSILDNIGPGQVFAETYALSLIHI